MHGSSIKSPDSISESLQAKVQFWYDRGDSLANQGEHAEALACFDRVLALCPDHVPALTFRSVELIFLERYQEALDSCNQALQIDPNHSEAWVFRGAALHRLNQYKAAYASYDRALGVERKPFWQHIRGWFKRPSS